MNHRNDDNRGHSNPFRGGPDRIADLIRFAGPLPAPSHGFRARLRARLHDAWTEQTRTRRRRARWAAGVAVTAALVTAIGVYTVLDAPEQAGTIVRVAGVIEAERGGETTDVGVGYTISVGARISTLDGPAALRLASGTDLRLDDGTTVVLRSRERLDLVRGRIYVDSESRSAGLVIGTAFGRVRDVGTQFTVEVDTTGLTVAVRRGLVEVDRALNATTYISVIPGFAVTVDAAGNSRMDAVSLAGDTWRWTESVVPEMDLTDRTLGSFLALINRQTGLQVEFSSAEVELAAQRTTIGGQLPDLPPRQALDIVVSATDFDVVVTDSKILIGRD